MPAKHRIPPSPKGSRLSLNVTGCVSHWLEWQSKVYLSLPSVMPMSRKPVYLVVWQYVPSCGNVESAGLLNSPKKLTELTLPKKKSSLTK